MGHAARDFDALGVNPASLLEKQRRDHRADVTRRHVHLVSRPRNNIAYKPVIAASQALVILRNTSVPLACHT